MKIWNFFEILISDGIMNISSINIVYIVNDDGK